MALTEAQGRPPVAVSTVTGTLPVRLRLGSALGPIRDHYFEELCRVNPELRLELSAEGELILMAPVGGGSGKREFTLSLRFGVWAEADGTGVGFSPSTGFMLPNGARRSPDVAWVRHDRWDALTEEEQEGFPPLCPDFVIELRSLSDSLEMLKAKMEEYRANGAQLGWLIDPEERKVYVYRPSAPIVCLDDPQQVSGDPVLPGFILEMRAVWGD